MASFKELKERLRRAGLIMAEYGSEEVEFSGISYDSRKVRPGDLFICKGAAFDASYLHRALEQGAVVYLTELPDLKIGEGPGLMVSDIRRAMAIVSDFFYESPWKDLHMVAVTGTKGKTTTVQYLKEIFDAAYKAAGLPPCGISSTQEIFDGKTTSRANLTTPETPDLYEHLSNAREAGLKTMIVEVSSQAVKYGRVGEIRFDDTVFMNISPDHISPQEHPDFQDYLQSKLRLFHVTDHAFINLESQEQETIAEASRVVETTEFFSIRQPTDYYAANIQWTKDGAHFDMVSPQADDFPVFLPMHGFFNVENAVAASALALSNGIDPAYVAAGLSRAQLDGRMSFISTDEDDITVLVDYAHNGLSVENVLVDMASEFPEGERIVLFGSTGEKAVNRREGLGQAASRHADKIYLTADDPAAEPVKAINRDIASHFERKVPYLSIDDRAQAIQQAILAAPKGAVVLLLGKGSERHQKTIRGKEPYVGDGPLAKEALSLRRKALAGEVNALDVRKKALREEVTHLQKEHLSKAAGFNALRQTKKALEDLLDQALEASFEEAGITEEPPAYVIEIPNDISHGDFASNVAMQLARPLKSNPRSIAENLVSHMESDPMIASISVAGPGFINFKLKADWLTEALIQAQRLDESYGKTDFGQGEKVQVEFVSANPTGLLHMGNARGGALGEALAEVLNWAGYTAEKEYYINDAGSQVGNLAKSVEARYYELLGLKGPELPEDGYQGQDIIDTAQKLFDQEGDRLKDLSEEERLSTMLNFALKEKVGSIRQGLEAFGVSYDHWFSEQSLHDAGAVEEVVRILEERGHIYEAEGAKWIRTSEFGAEKDAVLIRANGEATYFAADIAYHKNKFDRGFKHLINIWGADHHGHVARLKGAMTALGYDGDAITIILMQLVRLYRDGEIVRMSKRAGQYVTLEELIEEVGRDAARFFFVMRSPDSPMDFDLDLAKAESSDNPVYYVQYAHARISSILSVAGVERANVEQVDLSLLNAPEEDALMRRIAAWPEEVAIAAKDLAPYRLAYYAKDLANDFHSFYNACKVLTDDEALRDARLVLVDAARITLRNALTILGVSAPERM